METKQKKKLLWQLPFLALLVIGSILIIRQQHAMPYQKNQGFVFGTTYNITYQSNDDLQQEIEAELKKVDRALSMFNDSSVITRINKGEESIDSDEIGTMFLEVYAIAQKVSDDTNGAFDITVAPLVNAWGFGFKHGEMPTAKQVDSLRQFIGYKKMTLTPPLPKTFPSISKTLTGTHLLHKADKRMMLDCSAIAKGYGCDVVARLLYAHDIQNFMIEIGGEVITRGNNPQRVPWKIGVVKPTDDTLAVAHENQTVMNVTDKAMATSGNYRNFYYRGGKKYAHTIDPHTGYPVQHSLLSATVLTKDCATADAYATSFMVMGLDKAKEILEKHPELMAYLIYSDKDGELAVWQSPKLKEE